MMNSDQVEKLDRFAREAFDIHGKKTTAYAVLIMFVDRLIDESYQKGYNRRDDEVKAAFA